LTERWRHEKEEAKIDYVGHLQVEVLDKSPSKWKPYSKVKMNLLSYRLEKLELKPF
jgi:hypothetical protein